MPAFEQTVFEEIVSGAKAESALWGEALRPEADRDPTPVFSPLAPPDFTLGLETVYEAYLVHYGRPRLFAPGTGSERVLLGDYLYAHGLVRISDAGGVAAVATMAELISRCASLRAAGLAAVAGGLRQLADRDHAEEHEPDDQHPQDDVGAVAGSVEDHASILSP